MQKTEMMKYKRIFILTISIIIFIIALPVIPGCSQKDPAIIATEVAKEWASQNIDTVSKSIAGLIVSESPLFTKIVATTIENKINQNISWEFSEPQKMAEDRYEVTATAYTDTELSLLGTYEISLDYDLTIDTGNRQVLNADVDVSSFRLTEQ